MHVYRLQITLHDHLYSATLEVGRLFMSGSYLHNYALTYALGLARSRYHDSEQVPRYQEEIAPLNDAGIYISPAKPERVDYLVHTFKFADTRYHVRMEKSSVNVPTYGRARELAAESTFVAYALSRDPLHLPRWIRLGKWLSKAFVDVAEQEVRIRDGDYRVEHPLNPLDMPVRPRLFDVINMPPVALVENAELTGKHLELKRGRETLRLPLGMGYRFPVGMS